MVYLRSTFSRHFASLAAGTGTFAFRRPRCYYLNFQAAHPYNQFRFGFATMPLQHLNLGGLSRDDLVEVLQSVSNHSAVRTAVDAVLQGNKAASSAPAPKRQKVESKKTKKKKQKKKFDMSRFSQRHVALHLVYFGEHYKGLAVQEDPNTVEEKLFEALEKTCLIVDRKSCAYSRSGRTDKGVSGFGQVVALNVRSQLRFPQPAASQSFIPPSFSESENSPENNRDCDEIDYAHLLNKVLPDDIIVLGWAPAPSVDFSARFAASHRTYRYFFRRRQLDVDLMSSVSFCFFLFLGRSDDFVTTSVYPKIHEGSL